MREERRERGEGKGGDRRVEGHFIGADIDKCTMK